MIDRRQMLKGVSAGAGGLVFSPLLRTLAAQVRGDFSPPKRVVFVLFDNGFQEVCVQPDGVPMAGDTIRDLKLEALELPDPLAPFTPFKNRLTIIQGLQGRHLRPDHGSGFGALSGLLAGVGAEKYSRAAAESIDAAVARKLPGIFPLLVLGVAPGRPKTSTTYASSAWGPGKAIVTQCRPELAYESLFGSVGAKPEDFAAKKNLLDFITGDVKRLRSQLAGPEREQLEYHLSAIESLSVREDKLAAKQAEGTLAQFAPQLPETPAQLMPDVLTGQFDIAAAALMSGLTNVVTLTSGLCSIDGTYAGFSNLGVHSAGHNETDVDQGITGAQLLTRIRRYLAERTAELLQKLDGVREGSGTMLDNTLLVFTSDSANRQHTKGENWPFVLVGNLGGRLKTGRLVNYPMSEISTPGNWNYHGEARGTNPTINALYCTLLHALGDSREQFNRAPSSPGEPASYGPLAELLA